MGGAQKICQRPHRLLNRHQRPALAPPLVNPSPSPQKDLAKASATGAPGGRRGLRAPPVPLARGLGSPRNCRLEEWAPEHGPVRPLLQVGWGRVPWGFGRVGKVWGFVTRQFPGGASFSGHMAIQELQNTQAPHLKKQKPQTRPQLMCVLPAKSAAEALPPDLATLVTLAEEMDDDAGQNGQTRGSGGGSGSGQSTPREIGRAHV